MPTPTPSDLGLERKVAMPLVRAVLAQALATYEAADRRSGALVVRRQWPQDRQALAIVERAASTPAMTTVTNWAAELAQTRLEDLLAVFGPASCAATLLRKGTVLSWAGAAKLSIPGISTASATFTSFVGQGGPVPVRQFVTSAGISLVPSKLATIFSLTHEMISASNAEQLVRLVMAESLSVALDAALFSNAAGTAVSPPGLLAGVVPITAATGVGAMVADLAALLAAVSPTCGMNVAYVTNPSTVLKIALTAAPGFDLLGLPVLASNGVAAGTVICIGLPALVSVFDEIPRIDASRDVESEVAMDTVPPADPGSGTTVVKSSFQTDVVAIRFITEIAWGLRTPSAIAVVSGITW
jgi:HK97 family phage major capsid protein